jgi:hypothetical protein
MNTASTLVMGNELQSIAKTQRKAIPSKVFARTSVGSGTEESIRAGKASSGPASGFGLGENVQHGRFGTGRVMSHWPDGRLLVRFDGAVKSRLIFPSLLNRANGRRR